MTIEINGQPVTATEADGVRVQDYIRLSSDGIMIVLTTGKRHTIVLISTDTARQLGADIITMANAHDALMAADQS